MYTQFSFRVVEDLRSAFLAALESLPFEAFEETHDGFVTALKTGQVDDGLLAMLAEIKEHIPFEYHTQVLQYENWNAIWEASFKEILIDDFCQIRAPFHTPNDAVSYQIVIEPRMAFGTGHHETTRLVIRALRYQALQQKTICDFGSGTGILAILTSKMGASEVIAIEHDPVAYENLTDNIGLNDTASIQTILAGDLDSIAPLSIDTLLVNITKNVILKHLASMASVLGHSGHLITSGFLHKDKNTIAGAARALGLMLVSSFEENDWSCLHFRKSNYDRDREVK